MRVTLLPRQLIFPRLLLSPIADADADAPAVVGAVDGSTAPVVAAAILIWNYERLSMLLISSCCCCCCRQRSEKIIGVPALLRTESITRLLKHHNCKHCWLHFCLSMVKLMGSTIVKKLLWDQLIRWERLICEIIFYDVLSRNSTGPCRVL